MLFAKEKKNRVLCGVCGGLGRYAGINPALLRVGFICAVLFGGTGLLAYVVLALVMPADPQE